MEYVSKLHSYVLCKDFDAFENNVLKEIFGKKTEEVCNRNTGKASHSVLCNLYYLYSSQHTD